MSEPTRPTASPLQEIVQPFRDLIHAPRALWGVNLPYLLEGLVYFGWLALLAIFLNRHAGLDDVWADWIVGLLTGGITLSMLFLGGVTDRIGVRRALALALLALVAGRVVMVAGAELAPQGGGVGSALFWITLAGLAGVILGYGLYQPASYAAVREFCDERTSAMGYAMLYALMNLGAALPGFLSPPIRQAFGIPGVFGTYVGLTAAALVALLVLLTPRVERAALATVAEYRRLHERETAARDQRQLDEAAAERERLARLPRVKRIAHWIRHHPLLDPKFSFFIFALIPVQTLFAHNWLTLPQYVDRCMGKIGQDYMEFFVNFINPTLIFVLTPTVAALTRKRNVYKMMIAGTFLMAVPTFLLALGTNLWLFVAYLVIMSFGEAMWQPRFLQYAAEIAPKGRTGAYMGVAQFPWFLTKVITGLYAGWFLQRYIPEGAPALHDPRTMWLIYACVAMVSTALLWLARGWLGKDFRTRAD
jgi:MFS family permease